MNSMRFILFLAWRNVIRYRKRTLQSFLILFLGSFSVMLVDAYLKGYAAASTERIVSQAGHIDVHAKGYLDSAEALPLDLAIADSDAVMAAILETAEKTARADTLTLVSPSVESFCMLSNGEISRPAPILVTEAWARTCRGGSHIPNPLLADVSDALTAGHFFRDNAEAGSILDEKYAGKLGLTVGDTVVLLGNDAFGSFSMIESKVIGIARESSLPGEAGCVIDQASFAPVFGLEGMAAAISVWFVSRDTFRILPAKAESGAVSAIMTKLEERDNLEPRRFSAISASYAAMFDFLDIFMAAMMAVFGVVAAVGMTNAILLSVQDRVKDLGTLRAIAITSRQAGALVYAETLITGLAAALCALALGLLTIGWLESSGLGIRFELSDMGAALPASLKPRLFPLRLLCIAGISAVFPILAAALPAHTAQKMTIRQCFSS